MSSNDFLSGLEKHIKGFSIDGIINELPGLLQRPCNFLVDENEKEVFLIGALGAVSGFLPNIKGLYSGKWISPNLFVYVLAGYGGGKGSLDYARDLGTKIHQAKRDEARQLKAKYLKDLEAYKKRLKEYNKSENAHDEPPTKPPKPPTLLLYIPANNSKSGVYQLLGENDGKGIMFESEGDTLADALKQDYGSFSDTLRMAFHHERLAFFRRGNDELVEIENPELSVVLSSTFNQMKTLIPSIENGLFSRFLYYELKQTIKFTNVFDNKKQDYQQHFEDASIAFKNMFDILEQLQTPIYFWLTEVQQQKFVELFDAKKSKLFDEIDISMSGTANRLGIIAFRIMMILSALRAYEEGTLNNSIRCTDTDFDNALRIVERLEKHARTVYDYINGQPEKKSLAAMLLKDGKSYNDISKIVFGDENHKGTVHKWLNKK